VTAVSRRPAAAGSLPGVRHRQADLAEPASLEAVLDGADALFLLVAGAGENLDAHGILRTAKAGGVRQVVLLSSQVTGTRPQAPSHAGLREFEEAVRQPGLGWTVLRSGGFASNAFAWAESVRTRRTVAAPFGDVDLPVVDPQDIAEVAAVALREGGHVGHTYELTGPAALTPREQAHHIGAALDAPVRFVELSRAEAHGAMLRFMPEAVVDGTLAVLGEPLPAEQQVSPDIERILGRPVGTFAEWAARNIAVFG
jgi:uncharacterized protein YbjT (DUF2867 family)